MGRFPAFWPETLFCPCSDSFERGKIIADMKKGESAQDYITRVMKMKDNKDSGGNPYFEDSKYGKFEAIDIPNVDYNKALEYATA